MLKLGDAVITKKEFRAVYGSKVQIVAEVNDSIGVEYIALESNPAILLPAAAFKFACDHNADPDDCPACATRWQERRERKAKKKGGRKGSFNWGKPGHANR